MAEGKQTPEPVPGSNGCDTSDREAQEGAGPPNLTSDPVLIRQLRMYMRLFDAIEMSAPFAPSVEHEPLAVMTRWRLMQVIQLDGVRTRHLLGSVNLTGRVCSPIRSIDLASLQAITHSGRQYRLMGQPGFDGDAGRLWTSWLQRTGAAKPRDLTRALVALYNRRAGEPGVGNDGRRNGHDAA